ncbi:restriction endonuclease subunit S [Pseudoalteromonas luteoviolacea]|uniref:restriction endonuclease subunit S n=1 Tax=Pseudoalteromonas luteoviolacea TaxID=43657 RepID=UPI001B39DAB0|nr:restriction endonuclease subunit S [Pseudoalteromonas luteoviolacea]MBQ4876631.1 restriction endonuclease subunit S [Pseudoalteromonas luteoviolacea]MBQ4905262.1 restriction endonuclease subunit S [Pseudoalteromonas luteoviolacea]
MSKYKPYKDYKVSNVDWLGDIPSHWICTNLKRYCNVTDGSHHSPKIQENGYPFISVTDVGINSINFEAAKKISEKDYIRLVKEGCKPKIGDVLLTKDGTIGRACIVDGDMQDFVILSSLGLLTPSDRLANRFLYYYLVSGINVDQMNSMIHGSALRRMTISKIDQLIVTFPPFNEQEQIANFLDHETAKIDILIEKQQQLIKLLKEKRQAVISHAVTKGLNLEALMKDSGVEWLGEVPEHWDTSKLKYLTTQIVDGAHFTPTYVDDGIPFLRVTDIHKKEIDLNNIKFIPKTEHEELIKRCKPIRGDLLLSKNGTIGVPKVVDWDWDFSIFVSLCLIKFNKKIDVNYAYYFFKTHEIQEQIFGQIKQSTVINLHLDKIAKFVFTVPPINEQKDIVEYLDEIIGKYDLQVIKAEEMNDLLRERRTALISAAVTGKIDVRNWQMPEVSEEEVA